MQVLKLKKKTSNSIEMIGYITRIFCILSNIKINNTELEVLSYLIKYGIRKSTKDLIIRSQILTSYNSLENTITRLRKLDLVRRNRDGLPIIRPELSSQPDNKMGVIVQLENL